MPLSGMLPAMAEVHVYYKQNIEPRSLSPDYDLNLDVSILLTGTGLSFSVISCYNQYNSNIFKAGTHCLSNLLKANLGKEILHVD